MSLSLEAGLRNAIYDGHPDVEYPHLLVHSAFHRKRIGKKMMQAMQTKYSGFHQQILVANGDAIEFYRFLGFALAGRTQFMWIYGESITNDLRQLLSSGNDGQLKSFSPF